MNVTKEDAAKAIDALTQIEHAVLTGDADVFLDHASVVSEFLEAAMAKLESAVLQSAKNRRAAMAAAAMAPPSKQ